MDATSTSLEINSLDWWNQYFQQHWSANNGSAQTAHFMSRLIASLSEPERRYLSEPGREILDWGCAFGEGTSLLARSFPHAKVSGLDFAEAAVNEARARHPGLEFLHSPSGIPREFDAIVISNCLEHFDDPIDVARGHMQSCRDLYISLTPYNETNLCPYHKLRFDEATFPKTIGSFTLLETKIIDVDRTYWDGQQLLAIYASEHYLARRTAAGTIEDRIDAEREKWNDYYAGMPRVEENPSVAAFNTELCALIQDLLPVGNRILEAGCGAGLQSLAIGRTGQYSTNLMDFSEKALAHAQRRFADENVSAQFQLGDVFQTGQPEYDLVFNAGVLEHYTLDEQAAFLKGMASRSSNYVLVLVPNRLCYWYWIWRIECEHRSGWPFGKESPLADFSEAFDKAGLEFVGQTFLGADWAEDFIRYTPGLAPSLRTIVLDAHRTSIIPDSAKCYLLAALGRVPSAPQSPVPPVWRQPDAREPVHTAELIASLSDALASKIASDAKILSLESAEATVRRELAATRNELMTTRNELATTRSELEITRNELAATRNALEAANAAYANVTPIIDLARKIEGSANGHFHNGIVDPAESTHLTETLHQRQSELERLRHYLTDIHASRSWKTMQAMRRLRRIASPLKKQTVE